MSKVSIVILNYNGWSFVHQLLMDIYQKCSLNLLKEVLVVNNGCTEDESFTGLNWWMSTKMLPIRELRLEENLHFIGGFNAGLKAARGDIIVALSNDVRIHKDFLEIMVKICDNKDQTPWLIGARHIDWDTGWNTFNGKIYPYLEGWMLGATKEGWEELGYFDERYCPNDMEDIDLSTTALKMGYAVMWLSDGHVTHIGGQTYRFSPEREKITIQNKEKFRQKWVK